MKTKIDIIHGPNLNLLGKRQPAIYGYESFESFLSNLEDKNKDTEISLFQSNLEGEIVTKLQESNAQGIIINAAAYSHSSIAIADAIAAINIPVVNIHISNIYQREKERHKELISQYCTAGIYGMGYDGYVFALNYLKKQI